MRPLGSWMSGMRVNCNQVFFGPFSPEQSRTYEWLSLVKRVIWAVRAMAKFEHSYLSDSCLKRQWFEEPHLKWRDFVTSGVKRERRGH